jgi:hypothetical protein
MKFVIFFAFCLVAGFMEHISCQPTQDMDEKTKPFEELITKEIHSILENFFKLIKELIANVTNGHGQTTQTPTTTTLEPDEADAEAPFEVPERKV